jgi:hypothetical protein
MSKKFTDDEITEEFAKDVYNGAQSIADGIYVPSNAHPCGWDFISFEDVNEWSVAEEPILYYCISNGYGSVDYDGHTLLEILKKVHGQVAFELNKIDW